MIGTPYFAGQGKKERRVFASDGAENLKFEQLFKMLALSWLKVAAIFLKKGTDNIVLDNLTSFRNDQDFFQCVFEVTNNTVTDLLTSPFHGFLFL